METDLARSDNKYRYCDVVWENRHLFKNGPSHMFAAADEGHYDDRFDPGPLRNEEVALYVSTSRTGQTLQVNIQQYPLAGTAMKRMMSLMVLEFYVEIAQSCPWPAIKSQPSVCEDLLSEGSLARMKAWIYACETTHELCIQQNATIDATPPTRLIEFQGDGIIPISRLIETKPDRKYKYVALSHS